MEQANPKATTELTCWKCGEESLKAAASAGATRDAHGELLAATQMHHSVCEKCGTYSINAAQAIHNKNVSRKIRKDKIRQSNRSSA